MGTVKLAHLINYIIPPMVSTRGKPHLIVLGLTCTQARDVCSQRRSPSSSRYIMMGPGGPGPLRLGVAQAACNHPHYSVYPMIRPPDSEQVACTSYICCHCHERGNLKCNNSSFKFQVLSMWHHPRPGPFSAVARCAQGCRQYPRHCPFGLQS